jgi:hypothetical protein
MVSIVGRDAKAFGWIREPRRWSYDRAIITIAGIDCRIVERLGRRGGSSSEVDPLPPGRLRYDDSRFMPTVEMKGAVKPVRLRRHAPNEGSNQNVDWTISCSGTVACCAGLSPGHCPPDLGLSVTISSRRPGSACGRLGSEREIAFPASYI